MRRTIASLAVAGLLAVPQIASAQTSLSYNAQFGPATSVVYIPFHVSVAGTFTMRTSGLNLLDPMIRLFGGASLTGPGLGSALGFDDDGGAAQAGWNVCGGAGGTCHSRLTIFLAAGDYTLAAGVFNLTEAEARAGAASFGFDPQFPGNSQYPTYCNAGGNWSSCQYDIALESLDGTARIVTPEPITMVLLATGLVGVGGAARTRRKDEEA